MKTVDTDETVEFVAELMGQRWKKHAIKRELEKILKGEISIQAYERLRKQARLIMIDRSERSHEEHRGNAVEFYEHVISSEDSSYAHKINAQARLDNILGLEKQFSPFSASQLATEARKALKDMDDVIDLALVSASASPEADSVPEKSS